jgi:hypothetical protein
MTNNTEVDEELPSQALELLRCAAEHAAGEGRNA